MLVLTIEVSTSSTKSFLYDSEAGIVGSARESYGPIHREGRTDTEQVFDLAVRKARELAQGRDVAAIALCGTWHGISAVDRDMRPVTPTYSWDFLGTAPYADAIAKDKALTEELYRRTGCMPHNTYPRHVLSYLRDQGLELSRYRFLSKTDETDEERS